MVVDNKVIRLVLHVTADKKLSIPIKYTPEKELLNNAIKHEKATKVTLHLTAMNHEFIYTTLMTVLVVILTR